MQVLEQHFDAAFDAPDGIKKLRELILTLAMQGKLVEQDLDDQPASDLLKEIEAEKRRLVAAGKIKTLKPSPPIEADEVPYELLQGWEWVRNSTLFSLRKGKITQDLSETSGNIPYLDIEALDRKNIRRYTNDVSIPMATVDDILVVCDGSRSGLILNGQNGAIGSTLSIIDTPSFLQPFIIVIFRQGYSRWNSTMKGAAIPHLDTKNVLSELVGLPPLSEQRRIVARIDELMARCDELEALRALREQKRLDTHTAALNALLSARAPDAFAEAWQFVAEHFEELHSAPKNVAELRKAVLQLAMMGKLVPQDPSNPPARELLKEIETEKNRLIVTGKIRAPKPLPPVTEAEQPYQVPEGWEWVRMNAVIDVRDGTHDSPKDAVGANTYPLITSKDFDNGKIVFENARKISAADHSKIAVRSKVERFDILFSMIGGNIGNQVIVDVEREFSIKNLALFKYYSKDHTLPYYVKIFSENLARNLQKEAVGGAQPFVSLGFFRGLPFPLPPLKEQHQIIVKVNQLLTMCDQLEAGLAAQTGKQTELLNAVMAAVTPASTTPTRRAAPARAQAAWVDPETSEAAEPKRRGRPAKVPAEVSGMEGEVATPKRRGRPPKNPVAVSASIPSATSEADAIRRLEALKLERSRGERQVGLFGVEA